ncbi:MAG TPA: arginine--tRNA ligase [Candidatus Kapabacteria bacterium]|nr:arginine--tRNA ligase [Candidatus Kapabacteria bacterium]HPO62554.1 arginine--tRNA ligase [Candidatus Kapabacteria bacterium]
MKHPIITDIFVKGLKKLGISEIDTLQFETPNNTEHGDLSTNIAMKLAKQLKKKPIDIANELIDLLEYDKTLIDSINAVNPGFINIKLTKFYLISNFIKVVDKGTEIGRLNLGNKKKVNIEYVSANPTGLLHLGHGRNAAIGDTIANIFDWCGFDVTREYYFNNAGNQMNNLAKSIFARYRQLLGDEDFPFPEDGYHGEYIKEIAQNIVNEHKNLFKEETADNLAQLRKIGEKYCFDKIIYTMKQMDVNHDVYFNEDTLYSSGDIQKAIDALKEKELVYEKEGATWLAYSKLGMKDDRVIVKSSGEPTYRLPDIAYHLNKLNRGFDTIIDVLGSDHIASAPDVIKAVDALGYDSNKIKILFYQFVTLTEAGEQIKMSKRSGKSYTLDELLDEVGADVVRFFLQMRASTTHLEFDLTLAKEQSDKNPVFYLQYAHARICSIIANAKEKGIAISNSPDFSLLNSAEEIALIKEILNFEDTIELASNKLETNIITEYLRGLATAFHQFYHNCRIIGSEEAILQARINLAITTKNILFNGLKILGISAPEKM